jgi:glutathionylspermidine synthase
MVLELNAETPFFLWESHEIAGATARALGFGDPNEDALPVLRAAIARAVGPGRPRVAVTAYNTWREDWFSAVFAARVASEALGRSVDAVPLHELRVAAGALRDADGCAIDVLWRFYPLEHFAADREGKALFELIERGALRIINPPSALLLQNKAALAIIWDLAARGVWFDAAERAIVSDRFLPTYLDAPLGDDVYVRKPVLGREGNSVSFVRAGAPIVSSTTRDYSAQPAVYQRFVALPELRGGNAIATCFVVDGQPSAVALRVGGLITDGLAQLIPIGLNRLRALPEQRGASSSGA